MCAQTKCKMQKTQKNTANKTTTENVVKINLAQFADVLASKDLQRIKKDREHIYIYPDGFTKEDLNSEKGKKYRQRLRNKLEQFCNNSFVFAKTQDVIGLEKCFADFKVFYAEHFRVNDFTVKSITNSPKKRTINDVTLMLQIFKSLS